MCLMNTETPAQQATTTNRHKDRIGFRVLLQQLTSHGPLPHDDVLVIEGRDERQPFLKRDSPCVVSRLVEALAHQDNFGAVSPHILHFDLRSRLRHHHQGLDVQPLR